MSDQPDKFTCSGVVPRKRPDVQLQRMVARFVHCGVCDRGAAEKRPGSNSRGNAAPDAKNGTNSMSDTTTDGQMGVPVPTVKLSQPVSRQIVKNKTAAIGAVT
jgi:hypothetical protein